MKRTLLLSMALFLLLQIVGCGGGGGGGSAPPPTKMEVTLRTAGTLPAGSLIGDIEVTLNLPVGVTLKASPSLVNSTVLVPDNGVIVLQGAAASAANQMFDTTYVPGSTGNKVIIKLINPNGLAVGDFAKISFDIASGSTPSASDASITANAATTTGVFDLNTAPLPGIQVTASVVLQ